MYGKVETPPCNTDAGGVSWGCSALLNKKERCRERLGLSLQLLNNSRGSMIVSGILSKEYVERDKGRYLWHLSLRSVNSNLGFPLKGDSRQVFPMNYCTVRGDASAKRRKVERSDHRLLTMLLVRV
jgi:hypothetical protein